MIESHEVYEDIKDKVIEILVDKLVASLKGAEYDSYADKFDWVSWAEAKAEGKEVRFDFDGSLIIEGDKVDSVDGLSRSLKFAEKIIDLSLHWTGDDEERIPELKTIRTLAGIMMREDLK